MMVLIMTMILYFKILNDGQFKCVEENTEKYITFSVPIVKELKKDKKVRHRIKYIDSVSFMASSL